MTVFALQANLFSRLCHVRSTAKPGLCENSLVALAQELEKGEDDIIEVAMQDASLIVNELKVKVDLTKFTERHVFNFDDALDESVGNDEVYRSTVQPLVATIFKNGKATCFAYGQTGSGKTFTMQPLPMRAARDMFALLEDPQFADLSLFVSCFEIYGGKLYDLLNGRKRLDMREDGKKRVCIVDLKASFTVYCWIAVIALICYSWLPCCCLPRKHMICICCSGLMSVLYFLRINPSKSPRSGYLATLPQFSNIIS